MCALYYLLVLQFVDCDYGQVAAGCDCAANDAPFEGQRQHGVGHKYDKQNVPDQVLTILKANAFADESCRRGNKTFMTAKGLGHLTASACDA